LAVESLGSHLGFGFTPWNYKFISWFQIFAFQIQLVPLRRGATWDVAFSSTLLAEVRRCKLNPVDP
jgi:hypothetical protein